MKKRTIKTIISTILIIGLMICGFPIPASADIGNLYARSAVLLDADSGRVLFGKDEEQIMPMASTTKIMTCIVVLENADLQGSALVSAEAASQPKVHLGVQAGEHYYIKDLLYSLMLESHNDAAVILAEYVGGSVTGFADMMNAKAKEIGCEDTYFITPNGLDAEDANGVHATTAKDLALIMRYCIKESVQREVFLEITRTSSHAFSNVEGNRSFSCANHNAFLGMMDGALSGKTGFTNNAGYCYVGALERDGKTFIVALLACGWPNNKRYKWSDTRQLMEYGLEHYEYQNVWKDIAFQKIPVEGGVPDSGRLTDTAYTEFEMAPQEEIKLLLGADEEVQVEVEVKERLSAPIAAGTVVGMVRYTLAGEELRSYPITVKKSVEQISFSWCARKVIKRFVGAK